MKLTDELREMAKSTNPSDRAWCAIAIVAADRIGELESASPAKQPAFEDSLADDNS